jgi:nucleotide-binding universal stress UspA family protein
MRHILVGLDGSPLAETSLPFVEMLVRKSGARVTLLHVVSVPDHVPRDGEPSLDDVLRHTRQLAEHYLLEQQRRLIPADIDTRIAVVTGSPAREIVEYARRESCDVVALATHGRSGVQRWAHGSVADGVLHATSVPLLLVRPDERWAAAPRDIHRIVVPLDGSPEAATALELAEPLATRFGVPVVLLRFVEPVVDFAAGQGGMGTLDVAGITESLLEAARTDLGKATAALRGHGITASAEVGMGPAAAGIADHAHRHPGSLVVMTTHGRSGWQRILLGSVARRAVQMVAAPILLCPPPKAPPAA